MSARKALKMLLITGGLLASGCAAAPEVSRGLPQAPVAFSAPGGAERLPAWWQAYADPRLDAVIVRALAESPRIDERVGRLRAARAAARVVGAGAMPEIRASGSSERSAARTGAATTAHVLSAAASFELDLWGRVAAEREAAQLEAEASAADLEAARITLSGEVADAWYRLAAARAEHALVEAQIAVNTRTLEMVRVRVRNGLADRADLLRQRDLLESGRSALADAEARRRRQAARLDALVAGGAAAPVDKDPVLVAVPPLPATGVPASVIERRPDVRAARLALRAADRRIDAAVAAQYPRISLSASWSSSAPVPGDLFASWLTRLVGEIAGPVFDGGRRVAEVDRAAGELMAAVAAYRAAALSAIEEVETALADYERAHARIGILARRLELARETVARLRARYRAGVTGYLDVLDATRSLQDTQQAYVAARGEALTAFGALSRALAGPLPEAGGETREGGIE